VKTHLNLSTAHLDASVAFYRVLLDAEPVKRIDDYALFLTDDPGLELALGASDTVRLGESAHYGIVVESTSAVDAAIARLRDAGVPVKVEREETCCYAKQTKVWSSDPDGRRWEVYTVHEETQERDNAETTCCDDAGSADGACR